jgi:hypothetical protein
MLKLPRSPDQRNSRSITDPREADIDAQSAATIKLSFIRSASTVIQAAHLHPPDIT